MRRFLQLCLLAWICLAAGSAPTLPELPALPVLPEGVRFERLNATPYHLALAGSAPDLATIATLLEILAGLPGAGEPELRELVAGERGYWIRVVLPIAENRPDAAAQLSSLRLRPWHTPIDRLVRLVGNWQWLRYWLSAPAEQETATEYRAGGPKAPPDAAGSRRPTALARLDCEVLARRIPIDQRDDLLERAGQRLRDYRRELRSSASSLKRLDPAARSQLLDDLEAALAADLAVIFGVLAELGFDPPFWPSPAEMFSLLGDLDLIAGRPVAAAEAYLLAEGNSAGYLPLCGRFFAGKVYGVESRTEGFTVSALTGYLLAWDPLSGQVLERHLLPDIPEAVGKDQESLWIAFPDGSRSRLAGGRLEPEIRLHDDLIRRVRAMRAGSGLAKNWADPQQRWAFGLVREIDDRLPLNPAELEAALLSAARKDPTQPWYPFWLGQVMWSEGRRAEAETVWREMSPRLERGMPYYESFWMAAYHEVFGRPDWADRVFEAALRERRSLPADAKLVAWTERVIAPQYLDLWARRSPARHHLWWQRVREITGTASGDAFKAAMWSEQLARRGQDAAAREEHSSIARARQGDPATESAWVDYALYLALAALAMLFARLAVLGGVLAGRAARGQPLWAPGAARLFGLQLLLLSAIVTFALSLVLLAVSYVSRAEKAQYRPDGSAIMAAIGAPQLLQAWLAGGVFEDVEPPRLIREVRQLKKVRADVLVIGTAAVLLGLFLAAWPAGLLLRFPPLRDLATRWLPGARLVRRGEDLRGVLAFGLVVFAALPLLWLLVAGAGSALPAPGPFSGSYAQNLSFSFLPLPPRVHEFAETLELKQLRRESFWTLLLVAYPAAKIFWSLVVTAMAVAVFTLRSGPLPPADGASGGASRPIARGGGGFGFRFRRSSGPSRR
jgi:hypothetical protein